MFQKFTQKHILDEIFESFRDKSQGPPEQKINKK